MLHKTVKASQLVHNFKIKIRLFAVFVFYVSEMEKTISTRDGRRWTFAWRRYCGLPDVVFCIVTIAIIITTVIRDSIPSRQDWSTKHCLYPVRRLLRACAFLNVLPSLRLCGKYCFTLYLMYIFARCKGKIVPNTKTTRCLRHVVMLDSIVIRDIL